METRVQKELFWFLKEGTKLDLSKKAHRDMYIQQILSKGKTSDVKKLIKEVRSKDFWESFDRIKDFLPKEVKMFWEEWLGDINQSAKKEKKEQLFALCLENKDCEDLEKRKIYQVLPDDEAAKEGYIRVIDESGEDYLYPQSYFILVQLPRGAQEALQVAG